MVTNFFPALAPCRPKTPEPVSGFTLMETLVAMIIAAMSITVFFQVFSAGMRLESRARDLAEDQFVAGRIFDDLQRLDLREPDFPWEGEREKVRWQVTIRPVDVPDQTLEDGFALRMDQELYAMELLVDGGKGGPATKLLRYVAFPLNFLSPDFKAGML